MGRAYKEDEAMGRWRGRGGVRRHAVHNGAAEVDIEHAHCGKTVKEEPKEHEAEDG